MGYLTYFAYANGDVNKLTAPLDAANNFCGVDDYIDYPFLYLTDLDDINLNEIFTSGICVSTCPETTDISEPIDCMPNDVIGSCEVDPSKHYASRNYGEFCLPANFDSAPQSFRDAYTLARDQIASSSVGEIFVDSWTCRNSILLAMLTGVLLCVIYTALMSYASETLAWICIFLTWVGLIGAVALCWFMREEKLELLANMQADPNMGSPEQEEDLALMA